jgi:serpin B
MYNQTARKSKCMLFLSLILGVIVMGCSPQGTQPTEQGEATPVPPSTPTQPAEPGEVTQIAPSTPASDDGGPSDVLISNLQRVTSPSVAAEVLDELAAGNAAFAFDLYQALEKGEGENLFYSPYSISLALAMTYAGARGDTAGQMADTLHFSLSPDQLHSAFNALDLLLASRSETPVMEGAVPFQLNIANALWGQVDYDFQSEFLDLLAKNYGAGLRLLDFANNPENSRLTINDWVSKQTEEKIQDLIPAGGITDLTRLVLSNAIYFNAGWLLPFEESQTGDADFTLLDGNQVTVPMMSFAEAKQFKYGAGDGFQVVELPYQGGQMGMFILIPDEGQFKGVEASLTGEQMLEILAGLQFRTMLLRMPKFEFDSDLSLVDTLEALGMTDAVTAGAADFSGMDGTQRLYISDVFHKAFVAVDENGTEAAAATAVVIGLESIVVPELEVEIDRPFIFGIRDFESNAILFMGRVTNPIP